MNITGGDVTYAIASQTSVTNISGGSVGKRDAHSQPSGGLDAYQGSKANISGGDVTFAFGHQNSLINISGGRVDVAAGYDASKLAIKSGDVDDVGASDTSVISISGGSVFSTVGRDASATNISGGIITYAFGYGASATNITGGTVGDTSGFNDGGAYGFDNSVFNIFGGHVTDIYGYDVSIFHLYGGVIGASTIRMLDESVLTVYGRNLFLSAALGTGRDGFGDYTRYALTGKLSDGSLLDTFLQDYDGGYQVGGATGQRPINLVDVPEPGIIAFGGVAFGLLGLACFRRRAKNPEKLI
jgi:hypothetical protein